MEISKIDRLSMEAADQAASRYVDAVLKRAGNPARCRICGREHQHSEVMVSLMGNGITCADRGECAAVAQQQSDVE